MTATVDVRQVVSVVADNKTKLNINVDILLSDEAIVIIKWIIFTVISQLLDIFGIGTNIINSICFIKQGFKDPVNVSLFGLAVADLGSLITLMITNVFVTPALSSVDLPFESTEFQYLISATPHVTITRISGWITALITLERCLCIVIPLQVKSLVTSKRVSIIIVSVFVILMSSVAPLYVVNRLGMKYFPDKNRTLLGIVYTGDHEQVETISFTINNACVPFLAFAIITICTIILVIKLRLSSKWREKSTNSAEGNNISNRNQRVAKMVVMISTLFIVCFIPTCVLYIAMSLHPDMSIIGKYRNIVITTGGLAVILESINSSSNIFIYYRMSRNFRETFHQIFCLESRNS